MGLNLNYLVTIQALDKFVGFHVAGAWQRFGAEFPVTIVNLQWKNNQISDLGVLPDWVTRFSKGIVALGHDVRHDQFVRACEKQGKPWLVLDPALNGAAGHILEEIKKRFNGGRREPVTMVTKLWKSNDKIASALTSEALGCRGRVVNYAKSIHDKGTGITAKITPVRDWRWAKEYLKGGMDSICGRNREIYLTHNREMTLGLSRRGISPWQICEIAYPLTTDGWREFIKREAQSLTPSKGRGAKVCVLFTRGPIAIRPDDPKNQVMPTTLLRDLLAEVQDVLSRCRVPMNLLVKPHPNQDPRALRHLLDDVGLQSAAITSQPPSLLCAIADVVITNYSSTCLEARQFGVPVVDYYRETEHFREAHPAGNRFGAFGVILCRRPEELDRFFAEVGLYEPRT